MAAPSVTKKFRSKFGKGVDGVFKDLDQNKIICEVNAQAKEKIREQQRDAGKCFFALQSATSLFMIGEYSIPKKLDEFKKDKGDKKKKRGKHSSKKSLSGKSDESKASKVSKVSSIKSRTKRLARLKFTKQDSLMLPLLSH